MIRTAAPDVNEVQTIATFANPGETLSGTFTVVVDLTASGGSIETSAQIPFDAAAMQDIKATRFDSFHKNLTSKCTHRHASKFSGPRFRRYWKPWETLARLK